jgi:hypothetical protein
MFLAPIIISVVNMALLFIVFPYDTPPVMKSRGEYQKLNNLMSKIYKPNVVQDKIDEIQGGDDDDESKFNASYGDVFCSP